MGFMDQSNIPNILNKDQATLNTGLTSAQVIALQKQFGKNSLTSHEITWLQILKRQCASPFFYLLAGALVLSGFMGEALDCVMMALFMLINIVLGFYQEYHAENTVKMLKNIIVLKARVRRDGVEQEIPTPELVPGDIVFLEPGDIIPADLIFLQADDLSIDESILSGESMPVLKRTKNHDDIKPESKENKENKETKNSDYVGLAGTVVLTGKAMGIITATGGNTALGSIANLAGQVRRESLFARDMRKFSIIILILMAVTLGAIIALHLVFKSGSVKFLDLMLFALALAVSIVPEALPVVISFCLSRGAAYLAKHHVVVRRLSAIEDLGNIEVLCCDKTGTLTENKLSLVDVFGKREDILPIALHTNAQLQVSHDVHSFDQAIIQDMTNAKINSLKQEVIRYVPFDPVHRAVHVIIKDQEGFCLVVRGAPEFIFQRCSGVLTEAQTWFENQGRLGHRVLAIATKRIQDPEVKLIEEEKDLTCLGLISFEDPIKKTVQESLKKAEKLGVKIKIITGDAPEVAGAVSKQIGLIQDEKQVLMGADFEKLSGPEQIENLEKFSVFARVNPAQKFAIIKQLQSRYKVGFLGEGINDAPALKAAHVGLAVENATDIAKDASDIILLKKSLGVIIDGIEEGRKIVANTTKYLEITLTTNFSNFYTIALSSLMIDFLPLLPLQILLLNILSDFPLISIATDYVDNTTIVKPHAYNFKTLITKVLIFGIACSCFDFLFFSIFIKKSHALLQTTWFMYNIVTQLMFIFMMRTRKFFLFTHRPSWQLMTLMVAVLVISLVLPITIFGQHLFSFTPPTLRDYGMLFGIGILFSCGIEIVKKIYYRWVIKI